MSRQDLRSMMNKQHNKCHNLIELLHIAWRHKSAPAVERWILTKGEKERVKFEQMKKAVAGEQTA
jgi:hypothetical protein